MEVEIRVHEDDDGIETHSMKINGKHRLTVGIGGEILMAQKSGKPVVYIEEKEFVL